MTVDQTAGAIGLQLQKIAMHAGGLFIKSLTLVK